MLTQWNNTDIQYLCDNFETSSYKLMSDNLGRSLDAVKCKCHKLGLSKPNKYQYNATFFSQIDSEDKAYWLGFIYADGYIIYNKIRRSYELGIQLHEKDYGHLKKFNNAIEGNFQVTLLKKVTFGKERALCCIRVYSKNMLEDLQRHGITQNKSMTIQFPSSIPQHLLSHFIRGYFDGDGYLGFDEHRKLVRSKFTCGSRIFLEELQSVLTGLGVKTYLLQYNNSFDLGVTNIASHKILLDYMYKNCNIYLQRKYSKYLAYQQYLLPR